MQLNLFQDIFLFLIVSRFLQHKKSCSVFTCHASTVNSYHFDKYHQKSRKKFSLMCFCLSWCISFYFRLRSGNKACWKDLLYHFPHGNFCSSLEWYLNVFSSSSFKILFLKQNIKWHFDVALWGCWRCCLSEGPGQAGGTSLKETNHRKSNKSQFRVLRIQRFIPV